MTRRLIVLLVAMAMLILIVPPAAADDGCPGPEDSPGLASFHLLQAVVEPEPGEVGFTWDYSDVDLNENGYVCVLFTPVGGEGRVLLVTNRMAVDNKFQMP